MNTTTISPSWIAFANGKRIAFGAPQEAIRSVKAHFDDAPDDSLIILDAITSHTVELDLRGELQQVLERLQNATPPDIPNAPQKRGPGRPRLGVTAREVTLLPRHWEWLETQTGGASVSLRKLVETAMRTNKEKDDKRLRQESAYRFMTVMAGDAPNYEEATRALFADDLEGLHKKIEDWPCDIQRHLTTLVSG